MFRKMITLFSILAMAVALLPVQSVGVYAQQSSGEVNAAAVAATAEYVVTFEATWSEETHPDENFPSDDPHFSGLVGAMHNGDVTFWRTGQLASDGIKLMAERGDKSDLRDEVNAAISNNTAEQYLSGGGISRSPNSVSIGPFTVDDAYPLLTLVSMVAPSPDWFVGVSGVSLVDGNGNWINNQVISLDPYDSGTDDGSEYRSPNAVTNPPQPIANLSGVSPFSSQPLGTFTITRTDAPSPLLGDANCDGRVDAVDALRVLQYEVGLLSDGGGCPLSNGETQMSADNGDVDRDGDTDAVDALKLMQCTVGISNDFCSVFAAGTLSHKPLNNVYLPSILNN